MKLFFLFVAIHLLILHQYYKDKEEKPGIKKMMTSQEQTATELQPFLPDAHVMMVNDSLPQPLEEKENRLYATSLVP